MQSRNPPLERFACRLDRLNEGCGRAVAWLVLAMVVTTFSIVVLRYGFSTGWIAMQESVVYMHAVVFLVGAAYTLKHDEHVRVDVFYSRFSGKGRAWVNLLGTLGLLLPVCVYVFWISWEYVAESWALFEGSRETGGLPGVFVLKSFIPVMVVLLSLQGVAGIIRALQVITGSVDAGRN
jgi:TRAP-type mannitol/chloroaromatic compound transport system permease small subunit